MLSYNYSSKFKKEYLLAKKRGKDISELIAIMNKLLNGQRLPAENKDHQLSGKWKGFRDCHIEPDWILIYRIYPTKIYFARTGTHSDLF